MGDGQGSGSGILALIAVGFCAVMYYVFHIVGFGWILKAVVALLILSVLFCVAVGVWVIWDAVKQRKEREEQEAQKRREAELRKFDEKKPNP